MLFFEEPDKDQSCDQPDHIDSITVFFTIEMMAVRIGDVFNRPEIPVGDFFIELLIELFNVQGRLPGFLKFNKVT